MAKQVVTLTRKPSNKKPNGQKAAPRKSTARARKQVTVAGKPKAPVTGTPWEVFGRKGKQTPVKGKRKQASGTGKRKHAPVTGEPFEVFGKKRKQAAPVTGKPWEVFGRLAIYGKPHKVRPVGRGRASPVSIACINKATVDLGVPFQTLTKTLQKCFDEHFLPVWGYPVKLYNTTRPKRSDWQFVYLDDADEAGALGYHNLTYHGQPISRIFVKTTHE
jgi:hypothetical protein